MIAGIGAVGWASVRRRIPAAVAESSAQSIRWHCVSEMMLVIL